MKIRTEFDSFGNHATERKWLATNQPAHLRACVNAIVAYAQSCDEEAARFARMAIGFRSPSLLQHAYDLEHKARLADYLLGLA